MGFGGGYDTGSVGTGAVFDAAGNGFGGNVGVTENRGDYGGWDLPGQVSKGSADAWGPSFGSRSNIGAAVGTAIGLLSGMPGAGLIGAYGPGAVNSIMGRGGTPGLPDIMGPGGNSIAGVGASGSGGLLGVGNDTSQADALAALYTLLMAKQKAA
jgi:hypothetical protein